MALRLEKKLLLDTVKSQYKGNMSRQRTLALERN